MSWMTTGIFVLSLKAEFVPFRVIFLFLVFFLVV